MSCRKVVLLFSRARSHSGLTLKNKTKHDRYYFIFRTADPFATKLCFVERHCRPECLAERLSGCVQGQGHSDGSKLHCFSVLYYLYH